MKRPARKEKNGAYAIRGVCDQGSGTGTGKRRNRGSFWCVIGPRAITSNKLIDREKWNLRDGYASARGHMKHAGLR